MKLQTHREGQDILVISILEEHLDASNAAAFKDAMQPLVQDGARIVLDMARLRFVDSSGLGALLFCLRQAGARQGAFKLCAPSKPVRSLFELMRMHRVFDIHETCDEAVRAFA
ncbi:STAS domain-containing protein [Caldimonas tepidiphila]|uniref:STAS domain-containing protein n=1 Tax=Caldimonas tepidiphila TaxID=2315841 RepID=UPI000E5BFA26|nr:STAS domain-containing protein [Caldimonas tepidiphila]